MKKYLRWVLMVAVAFFLGQALWHNWQTVAAVRITPIGALSLTIAFLLSLLAHIVAGSVWADILSTLGQTVSRLWGVKVYLKTNLAKYLPGNIWHFYGRFNACKEREIPGDTALLSILLEPLLMLAAALIITIGLAPFSPIFSLFGLTIVLLSIHPGCLNTILKQVGRMKREKLAIANIPQLQQYPLRPLLGELGFLVLRGTGFVVTWNSIHPIVPTQLPSLYSSFSLAWLLGLVIPGLPGGLAVFEAAIVALLQHQLNAGELLAIVGVYRLVSTGAEIVGAGLAAKLESP
jgi:glycosyltransferase 2 family protein